MKYIFLSVFGRQKERIASSRVYNFVNYLSKNNDVYVILSRDVNSSEYNYNFCKGDYDLPLRFIKKSKGFSNKSNKKPNKIKKIIKNYVTNNISSFKGYRSYESGNLYFLGHNKGYINKILDEIIVEKNTVLITSSGPSKINYFGYIIKKKNPNVFWVADYRDLNQNNPYKSDKFNFKGKKMDKLAFKHADLITSVSKGLVEQNIQNAKNMGYDIKDKSYVLYNGFSKFNNTEIEDEKLHQKYNKIINTKKIKIVFTGTIYPLRRIDIFLKALKETKEVLFIYAGNSYQMVQFYTKHFNIENKVKNLKFIPKEEAEYLQKKSDLLLQLKAEKEEKGILTGKFFEYLQKNKRILSLGDKDKEYNEICKSLKNVDILSYDKEKIVNYFNEIKKEDLSEKYDPNIERFSWENLTKEFDNYITKKLKERNFDK
ncbi:hypothetical protein [Geotoga petraea]|uniref:Uncharacterized protein n=1 Tax=Geotoga petraea TaxID=28234 RepID=A0A4Z0W1Q6_9BACT|nr:hypothetical protein [Geotoga petraea]TGG88020.1 hypothetical protein E4650_06665 [Geotoga petraea]